MKAKKLKTWLQAIPDDVDVRLGYGGHVYDFNAIIPNGEKSVALANLYQNGEDIAVETTLATILSLNDC